MSTKHEAGAFVFDDRECDCVEENQKRSGHDHDLQQVQLSDSSLQPVLSFDEDDPEDRDEAAPHVGGGEVDGDEEDVQFAEVEAEKIADRIRRNDECDSCDDCVGKKNSVQLVNPDEQIDWSNLCAWCDQVTNDYDSKKDS